MNVRQTLLTAITVMLLATGNAWAHEESEKSYDKSGWFSRSALIHSWRHKSHVWRSKVHGWRNKLWLVGDHKSGRSSGPILTRGVAPEIDAVSGTSAIALLTGVLLLAGERSRSRHS